MDPWIARILNQVRTVPPACLAGFQCKPATGTKWQEQVEWTLQCKCGSDHGAVLGYPLSELNDKIHPSDPTLVSPLSFCCASCRAAILILDTAEHGFDAECSKLANVAHLDCCYYGTGTPSILRCPNCDCEEFAIRVICGHNHFDHIEEEPELEPRAQDFFDAFNCHGTCASCGVTTHIATFELA